MIIQLVLGRVSMVEEKLLFFQILLVFLNTENYYKEMVNIYYEYYHALQEIRYSFIDEELGDTYEYGDETRRGPHWFYLVGLHLTWQIMLQKKESENNLLNPFNNLQLNRMDVVKLL